VIWGQFKKSILKVNLKTVFKKKALIPERL
jgi:hypothetical protein